MDRSVVVLVTFGLILGATIPTAGATTHAEVTLSVDETTVSTGETTTVTVAVENISSGVGSFALSLSVDNPDVLNVSHIEVVGSSERQSVYNSDGTVTVDAIGLDRSGPETTLVRISVTGTDTGRTEVSLRVDAVGDRNGEAYETTVGTVTRDVQVRNPPTETDELDVTVTSEINNVDQPVRLAVNASEFNSSSERALVERPDGTTVTLGEPCLSNTSSRCSAFTPTESTWADGGYDDAEFVFYIDGPDGRRAVDRVSTPVYIAGDATGNGRVDIFDAVKIGRAWESNRGDPDYSDEADLNNDGAVNIFDAVAVGRNWQSTAG